MSGYLKCQVWSNFCTVLHMQEQRIATLVDVEELGRGGGVVVSLGEGAGREGRGGKGSLCLFSLVVIVQLGVNSSKASTTEISSHILRHI